MATVTKVIAIGDELAIILPEEAVAHLKVGLGDTVYLVEVPQGIRVTRFDPESSSQMDAAREIIRENRDVLKRSRNEGGTDSRNNEPPGSNGTRRLSQQVINS
jgi:putative addiction module antidote